MSLLALEGRFRQHIQRHSSRQSFQQGHGRSLSSLYKMGRPCSETENNPCRNREFLQQAHGLAGMQDSALCGRYHLLALHTRRLCGCRLSVLVLLQVPGTDSRPKASCDSVVLQIDARLQLGAPQALNPKGYQSRPSTWC